MNTFPPSPFVFISIFKTINGWSFQLRIKFRVGLIKMIVGSFFLITREIFNFPHEYCVQNRLQTHSNWIPDWVYVFLLFFISLSISIRSLTKFQVWKMMINLRTIQKLTKLLEYSMVLHRNTRPYQFQNSIWRIGLE